MKGPYIYNPGTKALHIDGFCKDAIGDKRFDSEGEAIRCAGRQIFMCTLCEQKREKLVKKEVQRIREEKDK